MNNNSYNDKLFFQIWRNSYIKLKIFEYIQLIKIIEEYCKYKRFSIEELKNFTSRYFIKYAHVIDDDLNSSELSIEEGLIPDGIIELVIDLNKEIEKNSFPKDTIKILKFTNTFQKDLKNLPKSIQKLVFLGSYNRLIKDEPENFVLLNCDKLEYLDFGDTFNQPLEFGLPVNLKYIKFGNQFNKSIKQGQLPTTLVSIDFGDLFNSSLIDEKKNKSIFIDLKSLKSLKFGTKFDQEINEGILPSTIERLEFGDNFNQKVLYLPKKLKYLKFGLYFNRNEFLEMNKSLKHLVSVEFGNSFNKSIDKLVNIKSNLKFLILGYSFNVLINELPKSLEYLHLGFCYSGSLKFLQSCINLKNLILPKDYRSIISFDQLLNLKNLKELSFGQDFNQSLVILNNIENIGSLNNQEVVKLLKTKKLKLSKSKIYLIDNDNNLKFINFNNSFNKRLEKSYLFESGLQEIQIGTSFNNSIPCNILPKQLKKLVFSTSSHFNKPIINGSLPNSIEELQFGHSFNQPLSNENLPKGLKKLKLLGQFNRPLQNIDEIQELEHLEFGNSFNQPIMTGQLSVLKNLKTLIFGSDFGKQKSYYFQNDDTLPNSLTYLKFQSNINLKNLTKLPERLTKLILYEFDIDFLRKGFFPNSLKYIEFSYYLSGMAKYTNNNNNNEIKNNEKELMFNEGLEILKFDYISLEDVKNLNFLMPSTLRKLILKSYFSTNNHYSFLNSESPETPIKLLNLPRYCNLILNQK